MAIYKLIANGSFGPDEIEAMSAAYETNMHVHYWHKADIPSCTAHVRYWG